MLDKAGDFFLAFLQKNGMVAIVILAVFAVRFLLRKYPKKYLYCLWAIVGIRMVFDLSVSSRFSLFNLFQSLGKSTENVRTISQQVGSAAVEHQVSAAVQNFGGAIGNAAVSSASAPTITPTERVFTVLFFVWITGMSGMLFYGIYSYVKCRKLVRTAVILEKSLSVYKPLTRSENERRISQRTTSVWECDQIPSPFVLGIFCPNIYIPFRMEEQQQQYILAHECCHIRRLDPLWKLLSFVLLAVYWWNPLVWLAFFYMVRDMEMSCDEAVIAAFGNEIKKGYSESLLSFAMERHPYSFAPVAFGEGDAGKRIKNVLNFKKPHIWVAVIATILIAVVAVVCLTNRTEFVCGTYDYEYNEESDFVSADFTITFREDGTYEYYEGPLSSVLGFGTYSIENGILTMKGDAAAGNNSIHRFRVKGKRIYFMEKESDNFTYIKVKDGQSFVLTSAVGEDSSSSEKLSSSESEGEEIQSTQVPEASERENASTDEKIEESIYHSEGKNTPINEKMEESIYHSQGENIPIDEKTEENIYHSQTENTPIDAKTEEYIYQWATAFCQRDVKMILKLSTKAAQKDMKKQQLLLGEGFGWSSPWPWGNQAWSGADTSGETGYMLDSVDTKKQMAEILYYARVSDPHVTVWKETIYYTNEEGNFQVTQEELQMYDYIASAAEFDSAYALGINLTPMDYKTNGLGEILNERSVNYGYKDDPLMDPIQSATYFLNLLDNENKVKLEKVSEGDEVLLNIHFMEDGKTRQVKMVQPWGKDGIWVPQDDPT